jgi:hypothetical protein
MVRYSAVAGIVKKEKQQTMEAIEQGQEAVQPVRRSVFRCQHCKHVIGHVNNGKLETETLELHLPGTVLCGNCGAERFFQPPGSHITHIPTRK